MADLQVLTILLCPSSIY